MSACAGPGVFVVACNQIHIYNALHCINLSRNWKDVVGICLSWKSGRHSSCRIFLCLPRLPGGWWSIAARSLLGTDADRVGNEADNFPFRSVMLRFLRLDNSLGDYSSSRILIFITLSLSSYFLKSKRFGSQYYEGSLKLKKRSTVDGKVLLFTRKTIEHTLHF